MTLQWKVVQIVLELLLSVVYMHVRPQPENKQMQKVLFFSSFETLQEN